MATALSTAFAFVGSRDTWMSFAIGMTAGLAFVFFAKQLRRKENR